jgi:hypothetical protein
MQNLPTILKNNHFLLSFGNYLRILCRMFADRTPVMSPEFILRIDTGGEPSFGTSKADGLWYRVFPKTMKEIVYIQSLPKNIKLLTPAKGDGVLVRADSLPI